MRKGSWGTTSNNWTPLFAKPKPLELHAISTRPIAINRKHLKFKIEFPAGILSSDDCETERNVRNQILCSPVYSNQGRKTTKAYLPATSFQWYTCPSFDKSSSFRSLLNPCCSSESYGWRVFDVGHEFVLQKDLHETHRFAVGRKWPGARARLELRNIWNSVRRDEDISFVNETSFIYYVKNTTDKSCWAQPKFATRPRSSVALCFSFVWLRSLKYANQLITMFAWC